jgi:putative tryptophan/tyrosine transport system substrate-binding protein
MRRREFIAALGGAAAWPLAARAQQSAVPVIGWLDTVPGTMERFLPSFAQGLSETGHIVGRNVTIESRGGDPERLPVLAADLVRRNVTVIVAVGGNAAQVAKAATQTIPVVFLMAGDPVEVGVVASLNRPSGNLTGIAAAGTELSGKRLELLHQLVPAAAPIAMLGRSAGSELMQAEAKAMQSAASVLGVRLLVLSAVTESEVAAAFASVVEQHAGALLTSSAAFTLAEIDQILSFAGAYAVPTMFFGRAPVVRGGLASYGTEIMELYRQAGGYTGRILKGAKPAELPVVQPTKFELVINLKTAKALGLAVPEMLLATADEVIQ